MADVLVAFYSKTPPRGSPVIAAHNTEAKLSQATRTMRKNLLKSGIDTDRIMSCLESNFALYC